MNDEQWARAWNTIREVVEPAPQEHKEPITTIEPILGLGEDYEPFDLSDNDEVWTAGAIGSGLGTGCFPTEADATAARPILVSIGARLIQPVQQTTVSERKDYARRDGCPVVVLRDANLNVLKTWPV